MEQSRTSPPLQQKVRPWQHTRCAAAKSRTPHGVPRLAKLGKLTHVCAHVALTHCAAARLHALPQMPYHPKIHIKHSPTPAYTLRSSMAARVASSASPSALLGSVKPQVAIRVSPSAVATWCAMAPMAEKSPCAVASTSASRHSPAQHRACHGSRPAGRGNLGVGRGKFGVGRGNFGVGRGNLGMCRQPDGQGCPHTPPQKATQLQPLPLAPLLPVARDSNCCAELRSDWMRPC